MSEPLENLRLFKVIVKSLQIAIKNSVFYTFNHPICANSIRRFKVDLEKWFDTTGFIQFGVAEDTLFLDGKRVEEPEDYIIEIAKYLHERGITSITISKFVTFDELLTFFNMIKESRQTIQDNGGISRF